ncbi:MAG: sodium-dependent transporter [Deltaproteobacteria bacterium]|jgi:NSS family neurotransmitter:Na+ symporter|nr:sodium-dependent transporter [Deltaproteobacteria bacterium]MBW2530313.1 sodium-dependent transporter [Deltaproteobacteria bacterium]
MSAKGEKRGQWGSRLGFILAEAGSAVGLGNIWKFPYVAGENGGGLFVLLYLVCVAFVGLPIMMAEIMIGRAAQKQPVVAFEELQGKRTGWSALGWLGIIAGFIIMSYYVVVCGWVLDYTLKSVIHFTAPIEEAAATEARSFRASASLDQMKTLLVQRTVDRETNDQVADIRGEAKKRIWKSHDSFKTAWQAAGSTDEARDNLLSDPDLAAAVARAESLEGRITEVKAVAAERARAHYEGLPEAEIRSEAETEQRRSIIKEKVKATFLGVATDGWLTTFWSALFMALTIMVVAAGISGGIERWCKVLMPLLFITILVMVVYGMFTPGFEKAISFVFKPDPSKLKASGVLEALGQAFFSLSLGMGAMITYGSYQRRKSGLARQSAMIAGLDTAVALLACMMMFPIIFTYGEQPSAGPGLVFMSMPLAFAEIGKGGQLLSIIFFGLLVFAALTSLISLLEVVSSYFIDKKGWSRRRAAWSIGGVTMAFAIPSAFAMDDGGLFKSWEPGYGKNFFDTVDYLAANWMLPVGGMLISIYAGWVMPKRLRAAELSGVPTVVAKVWLWAVRVLAPVLVALVLAHKAGFIDL